MLRLNRRLRWGLPLLIASAGAAAAGLEAENARLRLLPGDPPAAGHFGLSDGGDRTVTLVGAESPAFAQAMMHRSVTEDGQARMEHLPRLELAPGERVEFAPGGYHLMLMKRTQPLAAGDEVSVTLLFGDGRRLPVVFQAVSPASL